MDASVTRNMEISSLESHFRLLASLCVESGVARVQPQSRGGRVTVPEWVILRERYHSESAPSALADRLGMTRGAISKLADPLIAKDMIVRRANRADRRFQSLALTREGRAITP
jgi:DNA-binding MarR family transcriptional regulator